MKRKPRGLMIISQFRPITGGAELQAERLSVKLIERGHEMGVLTRHWVQDTPSEETIQGIKVTRVDFPFAYMMRYEELMATFKFLVNIRHQFDIYHAHQAFGHAVIAVLVARCFRKRSIVKVACAGEFGDFRVFSQFPDSNLGVEILKQADAIISISSEVEQELLERGFNSKKIYRIPNGVDTNFFRRLKPQLYSGQFHFILIGRRHPQKGIDVLLEAANILKLKGVPSIFDINLYGRDNPPYDYYQSVKDMGLENIIKFHPFTDNIYEVYNTAHCFLLPSRGEGLSNSLLEAMSMQLPVIATHVSGTEDVIENHIDGLLIPPNSPEKLATKMLEVMTDHSLAKQLGGNARAKVEAKFSLENVANQYSSLYNQLCRWR